MREGIKWIGFRSVTRFHEAVGADRKRRKNQHIQTWMLLLIGTE